MAERELISLLTKLGFLPPSYSALECLVRCSDQNAIYPLLCPIFERSHSSKMNWTSSPARFKIGSALSSLTEFSSGLASESAKHID